MVIFLVVFIGVPLLFTILNILGLIKKLGSKAMIWEIPALLIGMIFTLILYGELSDYTEAIERSALLVGFHTPLASWHLPTPVTFFLLSIVGFTLLRIGKLLPPLLTALCAASMLIVCIIAVIYIIQLSGNITPFNDNKPIIISLLYPFNIILLYVRVIYLKAKEITIKADSESTQYSNPVLNACYRLLFTASNWMFASFLLMFPLFFAVMIILILFGQRPDAIVRVFTDTSEWSLSQQASPPDLERGGHYLCTVAAQGNPGLVRPLRYGQRCGKRIIVNRQLCVANAFEQVIAEKYPPFHRMVRSLYDTYGFPLSRHITTKRCANIVYLLMKPLEYIFILFLYLVDNYPENRIYTQYLPTIKHTQRTQ